MQLDEDEAKSVWNEARSHIHNLLTESGISGVGDLEQQALQMVKFGMTLFQHFSNTVDADLDAVTNENIDDAILYIAQSMGEDNRVSHVDEFIGLMGNAIQDGRSSGGRTSLSSTRVSPTRNSESRWNVPTTRSRSTSVNTV